MEADPVFAVQILSALVFVVFLGLGFRLLWRSYFSRNFVASFPVLMEDCFDCSCPRGWAGPVRRALRGLSRLQKSRYSNLRVDQIKEKFGRLVIYTSLGETFGNHRHPVDPIIGKAERACFFRCQVCGKPGSHRVLDGWHATLCDRCEQDKVASRNCRCPYREK